MGTNTLGIDASESNIGIASLHALADPQLRPSSGKAQLRYLNTPAEALLSHPKRYDIVCSMEVLEHVDNPAAFLSTCTELLKVELHSLFSASNIVSLNSQRLARWPPVSVNNFAHSSCVCSHHPFSRGYPPQG